MKDFILFGGSGFVGTHLSKILQKQAKSFAEQYANKNLDGSKDFLGAPLPNDMRNSNSSSSRLIADSRFLNGDNALLISEGIRGFGSSNNRGSNRRA